MVHSADGEVRISSGKQRAILAALLLRANQAVALDELIEVLWGADPPASARVAAQNYVMRLRKTLAAAVGSRISTQPAGYLIRIDPAELDVAEFELRVAAARAAVRDACWETVASQARAALSLWRGEPLAGVESDVLTQREVPRLTELRLQALESRVNAELRLGRHADLVAELRRLTANWPLREHLYALLMRALYQDGQQAEALGVFRAARDLLVGELGIEPGHELRDLQQQILAGDVPSGPLAADAAARDAAGVSPTATVPTAAEVTRPARRVVPRQLPAAVGCFTGRTAELVALDRLLDRMTEAGRPAPSEDPAAEGKASSTGATMITAISGTAGVGKTALAVNWAHQVAGRFPDGQLYVNLRGFDPSGVPVTPGEAIRRFFDTLRVAPELVPATLDAQAALFRSLLTDQRMLILLDNARDADQVRPLLPGSAGCLVLITSRSELAGLVAAEGAQPIFLDALTTTEALAMLSHRIGAERVTREPKAVEELITWCARLPLALAVAGARAATHPNLPIAALAGELRQTDRSLDALDAGETATNVRAVFSWSYQDLTPGAARMFRLLGVHPGPDIAAPAAASLAAIPFAEATRMLRELSRAHLLAEHVPGRFTFHDLLRAYASEQVRTVDSGTDRREIMHRMLDHYLHTGVAAVPHLDQAREPISITPPHGGTQPESLTSYEQAWEWFEAEHQVLLAAVNQAADGGFLAYAWQIAWTLEIYLFRRGHWAALEAVQRTALTAAMRLGDRTGQAHIHRALGWADVVIGSYREANDHMGQAIELFGGLGDQVGMARAHVFAGMVFARQARYEAALTQARIARDMFLAAGHRAGQAGALNNIGWYRLQMGDYREGLSCCQEALSLLGELGYQYGQAHALDSIGYGYLMLGDHRRAVARYREAVEVFRVIGDRRRQSDTLARLGDAYHVSEELGAAREAWKEALSILDELRHPDAEEIRHKLGEINARCPS
jgi:DNA-binding SARP family transcriptional activator/tetratricopeptide (TPR) repeat protein